MSNKNLRNINYSNKHIQQKNSTMLETSFSYSLSHLHSSFPLLCRMVVTNPNWKSDFLVGQYIWRNRPIRNSQTSDWCNLIYDVTCYFNLYPARASKMNTNDFYGAWKMFSSHTMSVAPESSWNPSDDFERVWLIFNWECHLVGISPTCRIPNERCPSSRSDTFFEKQTEWREVSFR